jgi:hypothetical protein
MARQEWKERRQEAGVGWRREGAKETLGVFAAA